MEFLWFSSNPPANAQTAPSSGKYDSLLVFPQLIVPSPGLPPATPPATQRHWHATKHTSSSQATSHATSHSETLTLHKAHFLFTSHQLFTQYIHHIFLNPQGHYNVRKSAALVLTLSQLSPVHEISSYFCNIHFVIIMPTAPRFLIHLFSGSFLIKTQYAFIFTLMRSTWP